MSEETLVDSLAVRAGRIFDQYRQGDQAAMADLVQLLTPILWHTVRAVRLDAATAEDVLQCVWITLVRKGGTITEPAAVLQWLIVTARREAWRVTRVSSRVRLESLEVAGGDEPAEPDTVEDQVLRADADRRLWLHVEALPERCRVLLRVIAFADRPDYSELARALGMPQGSIGPTRGRCLAKLRQALAADPAWGSRDER